MSRRHEAVGLVEHLLKQYSDYARLGTEIMALKTSRIETASAVARRDGIALRVVLTITPPPPELTAIDEQIFRTQAKQQAVSEAMTYANPIVWLRYKHLAYAGTSTAITTMADLRNHCSPVDYICSKRYDFLRSWVKSHEAIDLDDPCQFNDDLDLARLYNSSVLEKVADDDAFMAKWENYEYHQDGIRVAKWENYSI